ncbi:MAG: hypothetical protein FJ333_06350, partial [Sphingomonadales bacterium]|nr:hypothetical protein [Sphingomonadales bacterium]
MPCPFLRNHVFPPFATFHSLEIQHLNLLAYFFVSLHCLKNYGSLFLFIFYYGIRGLELDWFRSYLSNRSQVVDINGHYSDPVNIDISVLQGSILGPILFNVFINDLPLQSSIATFLFADDTQGLMRGKRLPP